MPKLMFALLVVAASSGGGTSARIATFTSNNLSAFRAVERMPLDGKATATPLATSEHQFCERALALQQWNPRPGNPEHQEPPKDFFCSNDAADEPHQCACHRECVDDDGTGKPGVSEDHAQCTTNCYKDHCHCRIHNCP
jgi:hypothetical protein